MNKPQFLTLMHYKEPLLKVPKREGHGYYGALSVTMDGELLQCHVCGGLFKRVGASHLKKHKLTVRQYKDKFMLASNTALVSEKERERNKQQGIKNFEKLTDETRLQNIINLYNRNKERGFKIRKESLEDKNKKGHCPDQIIAQIHKRAKELGRTPTLAEMITDKGEQRWKYLAIRVFGSWKHALEMAKLTPKKRETTRGRKWKRYTSEQLLEYLRNYAEDRRSLPTNTDCKRGILPDYNAYRRHFGTFENARRLAGVYELIDNSK